MNLITLRKIPPEFKSKVLNLYNKYSIKYGYLKLMTNKFSDDNELELNEKILKGNDINYDFIIVQETNFLLTHLKKLPIYLNDFREEFCDSPILLFNYFSKGVSQVTFNFLYKLNYYRYYFNVN